MVNLKGKKYIRLRAKSLCIDWHMLKLDIKLLVYRHCLWVYFPFKTPKLSEWIDVSGPRTEPTLGRQDVEWEKNSF